MAERFEVAGLRQLGEAMRGLSEDVQKKISRQAVAAGAGVVRKAARDKAPKKTGALRAGIVMKRVKDTPLTEEYVVTISTKEMKKYVQKSRSSIVELQGPTAPKLVNGKMVRAKKLLGRKDSYESWGDLYYGRFIEFGTVKMPARPFLRPALEDNVQRATQAIADRLAARIKKVSGK